MSSIDTPIQSISPQGVAELRADDPQLRILDVRTGGEFETSHIPGSVNVPLQMLGEHVGQLSRVEHPVVLVCQSGGRARQAFSTLSGAGKGCLLVLEGGMAGWLASGGDVITGTSERWALDRQVRLVAGALVVLGIVIGIVIPAMTWLAAAVGAGLVFSAVTNSCAMGNLLARLPYNRTTCDIDAALRQLS